MGDVKGKVKTIIMDKTSGANDNITLGTQLNYDASNSAVAVDAINARFGTNLTIAEFLNFNDIGEVGDYIEGQVGG
jgi:acyl carrier protein